MVNSSGTFQQCCVERSNRCNPNDPAILPRATRSARLKRMSLQTKAPTIIDVANAAGVSKSLVSLALGGKPGVKDETRDRIIDVARDLGYRRNHWASSLVGAPTQTIGVALTELANAYHTDVAMSVEEQAEQAGYGIVLVHGRRNTQRLESQLERLVALRVDGIVLVGSWVRGDYLQTVAERVPIVAVGRLPDEITAIDTVRNDDELGAQLAVEHLRELGHHRILHVSRSDRPSSVGRRAGYEAAMQHAGLAAHARIIGPEQWEYLWQQVQDDILVGAANAPTAVFASNDQIAHHILVSALDAGLQIPEDLAVIGYDNSTLSHATRPGLSSIDQPREAMGKQAWALLADRIAGTSVGPQQVIETPSLLVRGSTDVSAR